MRKFQHIQELSSIFKKMADVLPLGESTMPRRIIQAKMQEFKAIIEQKQEEASGWFDWLSVSDKPGDKALRVIDKILSGSELVAGDKNVAIADLSTNFSDINIEEFKKYISQY